MPARAPKTLVRRLQAAEPAYSVHKLEADRRQTEQLLKSICRYPYQSGSWAKQARLKARSHQGLLTDERGVDGRSSVPGIEIRADEHGVIGFEVVAAEYKLPAGDFVIPLNGTIPITVSVGTECVLTLSSSAPGQENEVAPVVISAYKGSKAKGKRRAARSAAPA